MNAHMNTKKKAEKKLRVKKKKKKKVQMPKLLKFEKGKFKLWNNSVADKTEQKMFCYALKWNFFFSSNYYDTLQFKSHFAPIRNLCGRLARLILLF